MEDGVVTISADKFNKLVQEVTLIREILVAGQTEAEGEITEWVRKELAEARAVPDSENISLEALEKEIRG